jgi:hypothetical protein
MIDFTDAFDHVPLVFFLQSAICVYNGSAE